MISLSLKRKRKNEHVRSVDPCFLSSEQLNAMSEYEYADSSSAPERPRKVIASLEDVMQKSKRLQEEGNVLANADRFRAAIDRWRQAIECTPENGVLYELIAQAHLALDEFFEGIQMAQKATLFAPQWNEGYVTLARCQLNYGELDMALQSMNKAIELSNDKDELQMEVQEIQQLIDTRDVTLAQGQAIITTLSSPDAIQVVECKTNLARRGAQLRLS
ncbi:tetratricopeptide repeat domain 33-like [Thraustotheca clavata]|uniref:Tetratricopeptide repeat domain 33-like n=1 Tax=Thraustotheca clavata TaxID=74557 RepID=A0A1V9Y6H3_9STRA|nr:tetratricopeptide repeat domain 33-like [Thraustotheca clavata]